MQHLIILFYKYVCITNTNTILLWQKKICQELSLKGRVIIAPEGINGTLEGTLANITIYKNIMLSHELFGDIDFKESPTTNNHFPRLRIVVKDEIVNTGLGPNVAKPEQTGIHLDPEQAHALIAQKADDLLIIDCRNQIESAIGAIEGALRPAVNHFRDFPQYIDEHVQKLKDKKILMYCTGGVRCERASAYIKSKKVAKEVYHIKGGIHRYVEQFPNGYFKGKNYVFDGRLAVTVSNDTLGTCFICKNPCDEYTNCLRASCNRHFISCASCIKNYENTCSKECFNLIKSGTAKKRPHPSRLYTHDEHSTQR